MRSIFSEVIDYKKLSTEFSLLCRPIEETKYFCYKNWVYFFVHHFAMSQTMFMRGRKSSIPHEIRRLGFLMSAAGNRSF